MVAYGANSPVLLGWKSRIAVVVAYPSGVNLLPVTKSVFGQISPDVAERTYSTFNVRVAPTVYCCPGSSSGTSCPVDTSAIAIRILLDASPLPA